MGDIHFLVSADATEIDGELNLELSLVDGIVDRWAAAQAEVVKYRLLSRNQREIVDIIHVSPAAAITHLLIDRLKAGIRESVFSFSLDQAAHLLVILVCWVSLIPDDPSPIATAFGRLHDIRLWIVALSYIGAILPAGLAVGAVTPLEPGFRCFGKPLKPKDSCFCRDDELCCVSDFFTHFHRSLVTVNSSRLCPSRHRPCQR